VFDIVLWAHQIVPGSDELLHFAESYDDCVRDASEQRADLLGPDGEHETLSAMAVYRFTFRPPTASEWSKVLNGDVSALDVAVTERCLVGLVAE